MSDDMILKAKEIIAEKFNVDVEKVVPGASFLDDLGADSLDTVELMMALEDHFNIEIPDEEAKNLLTVQDAMDYINSKLAEQV